MPVDHRRLVAVSFGGKYHPQHAVGTAGVSNHPVFELGVGE